MTNSSRKLRSTAQVILMSAAAAMLSLPCVASADWSPPVQQSLNLFSTRSAYEGNIANDGGVPMVAWAEDGGSSFQIRVSQLLSGSWVPAGGPLNFDQAMNA